MKNIKYLLISLICLNCFANDYSACFILDQTNKVLKCEQIKHGIDQVYNKFYSDCVKQKIKGYKVRFGAGESCPTPQVTYQCEAYDYYEKRLKSSYYYYVMKDISKLRASCFQKKSIWKDFDPNSVENKYLSQKFDSASCLRFEKNKKFFCESKKIISKEDLVRFYRSCQLNLGRERYYKFLKDKTCPKDKTKYTCSDSVGNSFQYYESYDLYDVSELTKYCRVLKAKWGTSELNSKDYSNLKWGRCSRYKNGKLQYCDESSNLEGDKFRKFVSNCYGDGKEIIFKENKKCPTDKTISSCLSKDTESFRNRYLYVNDQKRNKTLKKLCHHLKYEWRSL